jgi:hypothetical protein
MLHVTLHQPISGAVPRGGRVTGLGRSFLRDKVFTLCCNSTRPATACRTSIRAGEEGDQTPISAAAALCNPFDLVGLQPAELFLFISAFSLSLWLRSAFCAHAVLALLLLLGVWVGCCNCHLASLLLMV